MWSGAPSRALVDVSSLEGTRSQPRETDRELFRRQVFAAMSVSARTNVAEAGIVLLLALFVAFPDHPTFALVWLAVTLPVVLAQPIVWWRTIHRPRVNGDPSVVRRSFAVLTAETVIQASLNCGLIVYLLPRVDPGRQALLVATYAGILGGGAISLSTVRGLARLWIVIHLSGLAPMLLRLDDPAFDVLLVQLVVYGAILVVTVGYLSDSFTRWSRAEFAAIQAQQVVELLLDDFEDGTRDWLWEVGPDSRFTRVSERQAEVTGYSPGALRQLTLDAFLQQIADPSAGGRDAVRALEATMRRGASVRDHGLPVLIAGEARWWLLSAKPRYGRDGSLWGWRGVGVDATDEHLREQAMYSLARTDSLTGLANRRSFLERLSSGIDGQAPTGAHLAIFDLDNFKVVNDTLGHLVGDELLEQVADRFVTHRGADYVARLGGDEFAVVVTTQGIVDHPGELFERYRLAFSQPFIVRGNRIQIAASVGCAESAAGVDGEELVRRADLALYAAKAVRAGQLTPFEPWMSTRARSRATLLQELTRAVDQDEFAFEYDAQYDVNTGQVVALEALLRWQHPTRGVLPASEFLDVVEESGLLVSVGAAMLDRACEVLARLKPEVRLAMNVSASELAASAFLPTVERALNDHGITPGRLELEVPEAVAATEHTEVVLSELRRLGVRVVIDHFGTGYSSLARIERLPVDLLKVDRAFSAEMCSEDELTAGAAIAVMRSTVDIAAALGIQALASGIVTPEQVTMVRDLGFDFVQGLETSRSGLEVGQHLTLARAASRAGRTDLDRDDA